MTDKPRPWPNYAAEARDRSSEEAQVIVHQASGAIELTDNPEVLKRLARIVRAAGTILRLLEGQGAKTRPQ